MRVTDYLTAIPIGLLVGVLGRLILPGRQRIGACVTVLIGIAAALLRTYVAGLFDLHDNATAELFGYRWSWIELAIQVGFAVVGVGLANVLTYTKLADKDEPQRRKRTRRKA